MTVSVTCSAIWAVVQASATPTNVYKATGPRPNLIGFASRERARSTAALIEYGFARRAMPPLMVSPRGGGASWRGALAGNCRCCLSGYLLGYPLVLLESQFRFLFSCRGDRVGFSLGGRASGHGGARLSESSSCPLWCPRVAPRSQTTPSQSVSPLFGPCCSSLPLPDLFPSPPRSSSCPCFIYPRLCAQDISRELDCTFVVVMLCVRCWCFLISCC